MGGKSHSSSQSQQTSTQQLDPQVKGALLGNYANTQNLVANTPSQYSGQLVAGFNPTQTAGQQQLLGVANSGVGNAELGQAGGIFGNVGGYRPQDVSAGQLQGMDLSGYMNPYTQDVTNKTLADLTRQNQMANVSNDASATQAGAFGGDRSAVLNSLTNGEYARTGAQTLAGLNQANYSNAQGAALSDIGNRLSADQGNQAAGLQGQQLNLAAGQGLAALSGQKLSQAAQLAGLTSQVGNQQQQQAQNELDASRNQFQTNLGNKVTLQQLINQALGLAGDPALTQSQGTSSGKQSSWNIAAPNVSISGAGGGGGG